MDADGKLNEQDADKALRDLFRTSGHVAAPAGMDARILQRIALAPRPALKPEAALLPKWVLGAGVAAFVALTVYLLANADGAAASPFAQYLPTLPSFSVGTFFSSPWLWMGGASLAVLLGLEVVLERKRLMTQGVR
ncbi:MAG: hypothetical protein ABI599_13515 [Flavobacteriales bacterium]